MIMKKAAFTMFLFILIVGLSAPKGYAVEKLDLILRLEPGQKYDVQVTTENKIKQTIEGTQQDINHTKTTGLDFEVEKVDANDIASIKVTYQTLQEKTESTFGGFEYDSKKTYTAKDNSLAPAYTALMGQSFIARVTPKGEIVGLDGLDEMFSRMAEKILVAEDEFISKAPMGTCKIKQDGNSTTIKEEISAEERAKRRIEKTDKMYGSREKRKQAIKEMIEKYPFFSEKQMEDMVRNTIMVFAGRPVGIGDSWEGKVVCSYAPLPDIGVTYTLKEDKQEVVDINVSSKIDLDNVPASIEGNPAPQVKMTGYYQGTSQIDKASGWIIHKKVTMQLSGQLMQSGRTVPMSIENTVTVGSTKKIHRGVSQ